MADEKKSRIRRKNPPLTFFFVSSFPTSSDVPGRKLEYGFFSFGTENRLSLSIETRERC